MNKSFGLLVAPIATMAIFAVSGCGDSSDDSGSTTPATTSTTATDTGGSSGAKTALAISADPDGALKFDETKLSAKAGAVTIVMANPSDVPHSVSIKGDGIDEEGTGGAAGVGKGQDSTVKADLKAGTYTFYCPVDAHEQAGMKGTLTVK